MRGYGGQQIILCSVCKTRKAADLKLVMCIDCKDKTRKVKRRLAIPLAARKCYKCKRHIRLRREKGRLRVIGDENRIVCRKCEPADEKLMRARQRLAEKKEMARRTLLGIHPPMSLTAQALAAQEAEKDVLNRVIQQRLKNS